MEAWEHGLGEAWVTSAGMGTHGQKVRVHAGRTGLSQRPIVQSKWPSNPVSWSMRTGVADPKCLLHLCTHAQGSLSQS